MPSIKLMAIGVALIVVVLAKSVDKIDGIIDLDKHFLHKKSTRQARSAGGIMKKWNLKFDEAYTSELSRGEDTLSEIFKGMDEPDSVVVRKSWCLNERHYGALTGRPKNTTFFKRTYDVAPAPMDPAHPYWHSIAVQPAYAELVANGTLPRTESLQDTYDRMIPYWNSTILPRILAGQRILIASHMNTIRSHIKYLDRVDGLNATRTPLRQCVPFIYEFDENMNVVVSKYYLLR